MTYLGTSVHGGEGVRGQVAGRAHGERVRHTEERTHTEDLGQVCAETREHEVGQQNLLLNLTRDVVHGTRVGQVEQRPPLGERSVCILEGRSSGVFREEGKG